VSYPNTSQSALPSCPPAPVIRMRMTRMFRLRLTLALACLDLTCFPQACPIQLFVILSELSGLDGTPPGLMVSIPLNGRTQPFFERHDRAPSQPTELPAINRIPPIMTRSVCHKAKQALRLA